MGYLNRREAAPPPEKPRGNEGKKAESEWRRSSNERKTEKVVPEQVGTVLEFKIGTEVKGTAVRLFGGEFLGSEARQARIMDEIKDPKKRDQKLQVAELTSERRLPGTDKVVTKRATSYVQTPDGRLHSSEARVRHSYDETARKAGVREAHEMRTFSPDGRVLSIRRTADRIDGNDVYSEVITEELGYSPKGKVATREVRISRNRELSYHAQQMLDAKNPGSTVTHVLLDQREGMERYPAGSELKAKDAAEFQNGFHSDYLEMLED